MTFRAVAFDLDGTLLDTKKRIRPSSLEAIQRVQEKGLEVLIATGRHPQATHYFHHQSGLKSQAICCNGACLYDFDSMQAVMSNPMQKSEVDALYNLCRKYNFPIKLYTDGAITYEEADKYIIFFNEWRKHIPEQFQPTLKKIDDYEAFLADEPPVWKYTLWAEDSTLMYKLAEIAEQEMGLSCEWWSTEGLDITRSDNTKGARLIDWAKTRDIDVSEIIVFGDNYNDISMISIAGLGVAMGQSDPDVKEYAKLVAPGDNDSDVIAKILQQYV